MTAFVQNFIRQLKRRRAGIFFGKVQQNTEIIQTANWLSWPIEGK
jgi:hypothetical protein